MMVSTSTPTDTPVSDSSESHAAVTAAANNHTLPPSILDAIDYARGEPNLFPNKKTENWLNTPVAYVLAAREARLSASSVTSSLESKDGSGSGTDARVSGKAHEHAHPVHGHQEEQEFPIGDLLLEECVTLIVIDGAWQQELFDHSILPEGVRVSSFDALDSRRAKIVSDSLRHSVDRANTPFATDAVLALENGIFIEVDEGIEFETPVQVLQVNTRDTNYHCSHLVSHLASSSSAVIIEQYVDAFTETASNEEGVSEISAKSSKRARFVCNAVSEYLVESDAKLEHYLLNFGDDASIHVGSCQFALAEKAELASFAIAFGSDLVRCDIGVDFNGERAQATLNGVYLPNGNDTVDYHTELRHRAAYGKSQETFRGIVSDNARAIFNGRIHIFPQAQKTLAELSNKNLLASLKAEVFTKPELEIYADDVQCAHGATVAALDERAMHYLTSRGISHSKARSMLSAGFVVELVNNIQNDAVAKLLTPMIESRFT